MINPESECYSKGISELSSVRVTIECDQAKLDEVIQACHQAILACGYAYKGELQIVEDE